MDLSYLLALQKFRDGFGSFLSEFMVKMTFFGEFETTLVLIAITYWCLDKELGCFSLLGFGINVLLNGFIKITACIYRPWIRDSRIIPYGNSMKTATGYSFPSGHVCDAVSSIGSGVFKKEFSKSVRIILFCFVLLVGFSRNFLGVHTPQDVLVSLVISFLSLYFLKKFLVNSDNDSKKCSVFLISGILIGVLVIVYAIVKHYPEDYDSLGKLLVDGRKMAGDTLCNAMLFLGCVVGWYLEKRFVRFSTDVSVSKKIGRAAFGVLSLYFIRYFLFATLVYLLGAVAGIMVACFFMTLYVSFVFPCLIKSMED